MELLTAGGSRSVVIRGIPVATSRAKVEAYLKERQRNGSTRFKLIFPLHPDTPGCALVSFERDEDAWSFLSETHYINGFLLEMRAASDKIYKQVFADLSSDVLRTLTGAAGKEFTRNIGKVSGVKVMESDGRYSLVGSLAEITKAQEYIQVFCEKEKIRKELQESPTPPPRSAWNSGDDSRYSSLPVQLDYDQAGRYRGDRARPQNSAATAADDVTRSSNGRYFTATGTPASAAPVANGPRVPDAAGAATGQLDWASREKNPQPAPKIKVDMGIFEYLVKVHQPQISGIQERHQVEMDYGEDPEGDMALVDFHLNSPYQAAESVDRARAEFTQLYEGTLDGICTESVPVSPTLPSSRVREMAKLTERKFPTVLMRMASDSLYLMYGDRGSVSRALQHFRLQCNAAEETAAATLPELGGSSLAEETVPAARKRPEVRGRARSTERGSAAAVNGNGRTESLTSLTSVSRGRSRSSDSRKRAPASDRAGQDYEDGGGSGSSSDQSSGKMLSFETPGRLDVFVYRADITLLKVDALVNPANEFLTAVAGLSQAISKMAGPAYTKECEQLTQRRGCLSPGETKHTSGGQLLAKQVVHTVGPRWEDYRNKNECLDALVLTFYKCMKYAERLKLKSLALPSISAGLFGVPIVHTAESMYKALTQFDQATPRHLYLKAIHFVDVDQKAVSAITAVFRQQLDRDRLAYRYTLSAAGILAATTPEDTTEEEESLGAARHRPKIMGGYGVAVADDKQKKKTKVGAGGSSMVVGATALPSKNLSATKKGSSSGSISGGRSGSIKAAAAPSKDTRDTASVRSGREYGLEGTGARAKARGSSPGPTRKYQTGSHPDLRSLRGQAQGVDKRSLRGGGSLTSPEASNERATEPPSQESLLQEVLDLHDRNPSTQTQTLIHQLLEGGSTAGGGGGVRGPPDQAKGTTPRSRHRAAMRSQSLDRLPAGSTTGAHAEVGGSEVDAPPKCHVCKSTVNLRRQPCGHYVCRACAGFINTCYDCSSRRLAKAKASGATQPATSPGYAGSKDTTTYSSLQDVSPRGKAATAYSTASYGSPRGSQVKGEAGADYAAAVAAASSAYSSLPRSRTNYSTVATAAASYSSLTSNPQEAKGETEANNNFGFRPSRSRTRDAGGLSGAYYPKAGDKPRTNGADSHSTKHQIDSAKNQGYRQETSLLAAAPYSSGIKTDEGADLLDSANQPGGTNNQCAICMDTLIRPKTLEKCRHTFCEGCIDTAMAVKPVCPVCGAVYGALRGNQPSQGGMEHVLDHKFHLPGHQGQGTIMIQYSFPDGVQTEEHPHPGKRYKGTIRQAFLPDSQEGQEVHRLLKRAFDAHLLFTVGQSVTTGRDDVVTWNDIHHKTSITGGPANYGYPDPGYLKRVKEELALKGIK